jgi:hypothetical protein
MGQRASALIAFRLVERSGTGWRALRKPLQEEVIPVKKLHVFLPEEVPMKVFADA